MSAFAGAIRYALGRWRTLTCFQRDGCLEIDNSESERGLRAVALGQKKYLFVGSDMGGERAAALYSLINTAKLNGLDPGVYLRQVLVLMATQLANRVHGLLPWRIASPTPPTVQVAT